MNRLKTVFVIVLILFLSFVFDKVTAQISVLPVLNVKAGEKGILSVNVIDTESKIARISMVVREYPEYIYELNDNGENGDVRAKDGIWSAEVNVPIEAYGKYNLDCVLYDSDDIPMIKKYEKEKGIILMLTIVVNVFWKKYRCR